MWYPFLRPALFALDPERAHQLALNALRVSGNFARPAQSAPQIHCMGLNFANRIGLAAGFDKNADAIDGLGSLGFGFIEVGTVTPRAQAGQSRPRLFRLTSHRALVNRLGFPNVGAAAVAAKFRDRRYSGIVGINIGKNADTPLPRAIDDYVRCWRVVRGVADYVVVNVSSPNTSGLRELMARERLEPLLMALLQERASGDPRRPPLLVKISPDLEPAEIEAIAALLKALPLDGVIATNTTIRRDVAEVPSSVGSGGVSGRPLHAMALNTVAQLRAHLGPNYTIIGVGGVDSPQAALAMRAAGADLVQLYTGLVYQGPALVKQCASALETSNGRAPALASDT